MTDKARRRGTTDAAALSAARRRAILHERTRRLATRGRSADPAKAAQQVLLCAIGPNLFGLPLPQVAKVKPFEHCSAAPGSHPAMLGLIADEGRIRPVLDLAVLLGGEAPGPAGWLAVLTAPLDAAIRLEQLPVTLEVAPLAGEDGRARALAGPHRDKVLVMLTPDDLLALIQPSSHGAAAP